MHKMITLSAMALFALAACAQETSTITSVYDLSLYPSCAEVQDPSSATDGCVLFDEAITHALLATSADGATEVQIVADGEAGQLIQEPSTAPSFIPALQDVNGDAMPDLLIPLSLANVNTVWAAYIAGPDATYSRRGEFASNGWGTTSDGLFAVFARSSAAAVEVTYYNFDAGGMTPVAVLVTEMSEDGSQTCRRIDQPAAGSTAPSVETAESGFCSDPMIATMFSE